MATPAAHKASAETLFTRIGAAGLTPTINADYLVATAHAHLATALGTGAHYTAADSILSDLPTETNWRLREQRAQEAIVRGILADR